MKKIVFGVIIILAVVLSFTAPSLASIYDPSITLSPDMFATIEACNADYYSDCPTGTMTATIQSNYLWGDIKIDFIRLDDLDSAFAITEDNCTGTYVAAGGDCEVNLEFQPSSSSYYQTNFVVKYTKEGARAYVDARLKGYSYAPEPSLFPPVVNFGSKELNSRKEWLYVEILNKSRASVEISNTVLNEDISDAAFGVDTTCVAATLKPEVEQTDNSCSMGVSFYPTDATTVDSTLYGYADIYIAHLVGDLQDDLIGKVIEAGSKDIEISTAGFDFGDQTIDTTSSVKTFTVTNVGGVNITMGEIELDSTEFSIEHDCPGSGELLEFGEFCTVSVTFLPTGTAGISTATISINNDAEDSPQVVLLEGNAIDLNEPSVSLSSRSVDFGNQIVDITTKRYVTMVNKGGVDLVVGTITATGDSQFSVAEPDTDCDDNTIAPSGRCKIVIEYATTQTENVTATISINDNAADTPQTIEVEGTGVESLTPGASLSATELNFGDQTASTSASQMLTITNSGTSELYVSLVTIDGSGAMYFGMVDGCSLESVEVDSTCTIEVFFQPLEYVTYSAILSVDDNSEGSPQTVLLSGTGIYVPQEGGGCSLISVGKPPDLWLLVLAGLLVILIMNCRSRRTSRKNR